MAAVLWPTGIQGVLTHDTALDLWDVSDVNPAKTHTTCAPRTPPTSDPRTYVIHREDLDPVAPRAIVTLRFTAAPGYRRAEASIAAMSPVKTADASSMPRV